MYIETCQLVNTQNLNHIKKMKWCSECSKIIHLIFTSTWLKCYMMHWYYTLSATLHLPRKWTDHIFFRQWHVADVTQGSNLRNNSPENPYDQSHWRPGYFRTVPGHSLLAILQYSKCALDLLKNIRIQICITMNINFSKYQSNTIWYIFKIWFLFRNLSAFSILRFDFLKHN